jgi:rhamnosyl/mannosyltransferase
VSRFHVAMVNKLYPPWNGGMELYLARLSERLVAADCTVTALVGQRDHGLRLEETIAGVRVIRGRTLARIARTPIVVGYRRMLREAQADLVHFHTPYPWGEFAALTARLSAPFVVTYYHDIVRQRLLGAAYRPMCEKLLARARRVLVWSDRMLASPVLAAHREKVVVMPGAIDTARFLPTDASRERASAYRRRLAIGGRVVLFVGRLVYYKGLLDLIEAMHGIDATLVVAGEGPLRAPLLARARQLGLDSRVRLLGDVSDEELPLLYQASDVLALPSTHKTEAFGLVQIEAHASGIPSICTDLGTGVTTANVHGETGLVVAPNAPGALHDALITLLEDDGLRHAMGRRAQARAVRDFDLGAHTEQMLSLYVDVLERG